MMQHFRHVVFSAFLASLICVVEARAENHSPVAKLDLDSGDCVVFLGDSITHQRLYTQYVEDFFYTRFPNKRIKFHNAGVGGAKAWDALERFEPNDSSRTIRAERFEPNDGRDGPPTPILSVVAGQSFSRRRVGTILLLASHSWRACWFLKNASER